MCSLHFSKDDFFTESQDTNPTRKQENFGRQLQRKKLKPGAIPNTFPNLPSYFSKEHSKPRSGNATSFSHREREEEKLEAQIDAFIQADKFESFDVLSENSQSVNLPSNGHLIKENDSLIYFGLAWDETIPKISFSLVSSSLAFALSCNGASISSNRVKHIVESCKLAMYSSISNILAYLKARYESPELSTEELIQQCAERLGEIDMSAVTPKLVFLKEQLMLSTKPKFSRRYSGDLLATAALWKTTSPALYKQLLAEDLLTLPNSHHLQHLMKPLEVDAGLTASSIAYLKGILQHGSRHGKTNAN